MADLYQQRQMIWIAMRNLVLQVETSKRSMTKMQIAAFDQLHHDLDAIDRQLRKLTAAPVTAAPARTTAYHGGGLIAPGTITAAPVTATTFDGERVTLSTEPEPEACSCGYYDHSHRLPALGIASSKIKMADDYERYKELYATTGDESAKAKMLDCVTIE